ncbi:MAG: DUF1028 domain-containing protein [Candidatus Bathycorpusculaceae bacterium]
MEDTKGTFSILAISPDSKFMGVAVASGSTSVGDRVPHAMPSVGVIATQAYTRVIYGTEGLKLLARGFSPTEAMNKLLAKDANREKRQVAIMDFKNRKAVFTGAETPEFRGELVSEECIVIGNLLSGKNVIDRIAEKFESTNGDLASRMLEAIMAGSETGGDRRGEKSAALIVVSLENVILRIKVDEHLQPIEELRRKLQSLSFY